MDRFEFDDVYVRRLREHDPVVEEHFSKAARELLFSKLVHALPRDAVDDVIQETLRRVLTDLGKLRESGALGGFVRGYANHVLQEFYRQKSRTEPLEDAHTQHLAAKTNIEAELASAEASARVRRVLARMPPRDADILRAVLLDEEEKDEVAQRFGVDREYLRVLLHRAIKRFKAEHARKSNPNITPETFLLDSSLSL